MAGARVGARANSAISTCGAAGTDPRPAIWDLKYRDVRVRNVPTNIRTWSGNSRQHELGPKTACRKLTAMRHSRGTEPLRA